MNDIVDGFGDAFWDEGNEGISVTWIDMYAGDKKKIADLLEEYLDIETIDDEDKKPVDEDKKPGDEKKDD